MRVLLTNDDGISAAGLAALEEALTSQGAEVVVAAPEQERSGASHSVSLRRHVEIAEVGPRRYAVAGTPVDATHLALNLLFKDEPPDLVISGVNRGANLGCDIHYSGTVAAAREGAMHNLPSFAVSLDTDRESPDFSYAARFAARFAELLLEHPGPPRTFYNINLPDLPGDQLKGVKVTTQGIRRYNSVTEVELGPNGERRVKLGGAPLGGEPISDSDIMAVSQGYISVTPLRLDLTMKEAMEWLHGLLNHGRLFRP